MKIINTEFEILGPRDGAEIDTIAIRIVSSLKVAKRIAAQKNKWKNKGPQERNCQWTIPLPRFLLFGERDDLAEITYVRPIDLADGSKELEEWKDSLSQAEVLTLGCLNSRDRFSHQVGLASLTGDERTEIVIIENPEQWGRIFKFYVDDESGGPGIRKIFTSLKRKLSERYPEHFAA